MLINILAIGLVLQSMIIIALAILYYLKNKELKELRILYVQEALDKIDVYIESSSIDELIKHSNSKMRTD